jgi:hypothetical protein
MEWHRWEPLYTQILADFGYARADDEAARDLMERLCAGNTHPDLRAMRRALEGREVCIVGPLETGPPDAPLIATDAAMGWLRARPVAIVTDLDGDIDAQRAASARGVPVFLHAHGDNRDTLHAHAASFRGPLQPTTQAQPTGDVANYGGFTDGDRACCLAAHLGASSLLLAGFDFDSPVAKPGRDPAVKRRKLAWAKRIIESLEIPSRVV